MKSNVKKAIYIGTLCSVSYLAVYFARNILGTVTPQMIAGGGFTTEYIGKTSSMYFIFYAIGQLVNGAIGDKIKARYMISIGLAMAGVTNMMFSYLSQFPDIAMIIYGMTGFFLSMIYGPMTKVVAENTDPLYATRCSLGYTFASFFGSPLAGVAAAALPKWESVFTLSSAILFIMAVTSFCFFIAFEKKGIVKYNQYKPVKEKGGSIKVLIQHRIIKFTLISIITGVIRTTVVFWMPTYFSQYLGYDADTAAMMFTVSTLIISTTAFVAVFVYEKMKHNMDRVLLLMFSLATLFFAGLYFIKNPIINVGLIILAIMASNSAATMLWSRYCPSLRDTGMVSGATGFLDFVSYISAATSSTIFANSVTAIGWGNLILVWAGLMLFGVLISLPDKRKKINRTGG